MNLFKHQKEGVEFLKARSGAILGDEMGLGKTRQEIVSLGEITEEVNVIVCPASLKLNWEREIKMVYPEDVVAVLGAKYKGDLQGASWIVLNYDIQKKWVPEILKLGEFNLVGDEAHYIKNSKKERTKHFLSLATKAKRVHLLTGTPIENRPVELFILLKAIKHPLGKLKGKYEERYCGAVPMVRVFDRYNKKTFVVHRSQAFGFLKDRRRYQVQFYVDARGASNLDELAEKISDVFLRRLKKDVTDLPEKIISEIPVEISSEDRKRYDSAFDDYIEFLRGNPINGKNVDNVMMARHLVELQKIKQVCSEAKIFAVIEAVEDIIESGEKVVVFTQYAETLRKYFNEFGRFGVVKLSGETSMEERQRVVDEFQKDAGVGVFVGNIKAAGVGITLTAATQVIFADLEWTPALHDQAMDRCHRIGQTGTVNVRYFVAKDTVEDDIIEMLEEKRKVISAVMDGSGEAVEGVGVADVIARIGKRG